MDFFSRRRQHFRSSLRSPPSPEIALYSPTAWRSPASAFEILIFQVLELRHLVHQLRAMNLVAASQASHVTSPNGRRIRSVPTKKRPCPGWLPDQGSFVSEDLCPDTRVGPSLMAPRHCCWTGSRLQAGTSTRRSDAKLSANFNHLVTDGACTKLDGCHNFKLALGDKCSAQLQEIYPPCYSSLKGLQHQQKNIHVSNVTSKTC